MTLFLWRAGQLWEKNSRLHWLMKAWRTNQDFAPRFCWTCRSFWFAFWWWRSVLLGQGMPHCTAYQQSRFLRSRWFSQTALLQLHAARCCSEAVDGWRPQLKLFILILLRFLRCLLGFSRVGLTGLGASKRPSANEPMTFGRTLWATAMDVSKHAMTEQKAKSECKVLSEKVESLISALPSAKATSPMLTMLQKQICSCIPAVDAVNLALVSKDEEAVANAQVLRGILDKLHGALGEFHEKEAGVEQVSKEIASLWLNTDNIKLQLSASSLECFFKSTIAGQVHFG